MADSSNPTQLRSNGQVPAASSDEPGIVDERKTHTAQQRVRRRNRLISSCLECRRRKLKCDRVNPCTACVKNSRQCFYIPPSFDAAAQARLAEVKEKMGILEKSLEDGIARRDEAQAGWSTSSRVSDPGQHEPHGEEQEGDTEDLRPSEFIREDAAYYEDEEDSDDVVDLGIALGKVRITERIGGLVRPKFSDELGQSLKELPKREPQDPMSSVSSSAEWMMPSDDYVAPSSSFLFTPGAERTTLMNYLPAKVMVDRLIAQYWQAVHVVAKTVHRPSFERHYDKFWKSLASGVQPRNSLQAMVFAILLSSAVSMSHDKVLTEFGVEKRGLVDNFREATEAALSRANFLRTTKLETLQAFVMYLIPLCRAEVSRAHSALTGTCIRLAECMGLHKDPSMYSTSPVECQVRRLIWHQICFLDLRTCEATGPRPQIRSDDYDTHLPLNIDDIDLDRAERGDSSVDVTKDRTYFTDMTIMRMRFECYEMHRYLWVERAKLEHRRKEGEKKATINTLLARVQSFGAAMEKTYVPMLSKTAPLHALASQIYGILSNRLYIHILQKFLSSDGRKMPERLRQIVISSAIMTLEHSQNIEEQPVLSTWSWYVGALHQYHSALLVLNELYASSYTPELEQRAWRVLDFAFELGAGMTNTEKVRAVLEELRNKMQVYQSIKRWRAPKDMPQAGPRTFAPGFLKQQAAEERARDNSSHITTGAIQKLPIGNRGIQMSSPVQQDRLSRLPESQSQSSGFGAIDFPGAMPNADWGTFDGQLPASTSSLQSSISPEVYAIPNYPEVLDSSLLPPGRDPDPISISATNAAPANSGGNMVLDALNDVDWDEIDHLFGGADMGTGNVMIPPFAFPQFSATDLSDLQWPQEG